MTKLEQSMVGKRVRLVSPMVNPDSQWKPVEDEMPAGLEGTIYAVNSSGPVEYHQLSVRWDNGRTLALLPHDTFQILN